MGVGPMGVGSMGVGPMGLGPFGLTAAIERGRQAYPGCNARGRRTAL